MKIEPLIHMRLRIASIIQNIFINLNYFKIDQNQFLDMLKMSKFD
jgi:hypothetical protein